MGEEGSFVAPGWVLDGQGRLMRELKPHMGRRLPDFDYSQRRIYEITIVLEDRRPILGRLVKRGEGDWAVEPTEIGGIVLACWREIAVRWPQVELIEDQLMPEHFHGVLFVKEQLPKGKSLGNIIGSFKSRSTSEVGKYLAARGGGPGNLAARGEGPGNLAARGGGPNEGPGSYHPFRQGAARPDDPLPARQSAAARREARASRALQSDP